MIKSNGEIMKKLLTYVAIMGAVLTIFGTAISVQAESIDENYPPIIQKLAERFNLNIDELKEFFDENRGERKEEMQRNLPEKTELTEEKKEQIEIIKAKQEELKERYGLSEDLSAEERKVKMEAMREEMKTWAEENGINCPEMMFGFGGGRKGNHFGPRSEFNPRQSEE